MIYEAQYLRLGTDSISFYPKEYVKIAIISLLFSKTKTANCIFAYKFTISIYDYIDAQILYFKYCISNNREWNSGLDFWKCSPFSRQLDNKSLAFDR